MYIDGMAIRKLTSVYMKNAGDDWQEMTWSRDHYTSWNFTADIGTRLLTVRPPISIKAVIDWLTIGKDVVTVTADNVIPVGWQPGVTYYNVAGQQASTSMRLVISELVLLISLVCSCALVYLASDV